MTESKFNYEHTCSNMIEYYGELKKRTDEPNVRRLLDREAWIIFGPTRSGKSTLLSRIMSDMPPGEFYNEICDVAKKRDKRSIVPGVKIGGGFDAVTIVPNFYPNKDKLIIDLAGFYDPSSGIAPIISLINYALFPRINKCKILAIMELTSLNSLNMQMQTYVDEFRSLFTDRNFRMGIESCAFIFSKVDVYESTLADKSDLLGSIKDVLRNYVTETIGFDEQFATPLAGKVFKRFTYVDYRVDKSEDILNKIDKMVSDLSPLESRGMNFTAVTTTSVLAREGKIAFDLYREMISEIESIINVCNENSEKAHNGFSKDLIKLRDDEKKMKDRIRSNNEEIAKTKNTTEIINKRLPQVTVELKKVDDELGIAKNQKESSEKNNGNDKILQINPTGSNNIGVVRNDERIVLELIKPLGADGNLNVIILSYDVYSGSASRMNICKTYQNFIELKIPTLYYNGTRVSNDIDVKTSVSKRGNPCLDVSGRQPFVLLTLCDISLVNSPLYEKFMKIHIDRITQLEERKDRLITESFDCTKALKEAKKREEDLIEEVKILESHLGDSMIKLQNIKLEYSESTKRRVDMLEGHSEKMLRLLGSSKFVVTSKLCEILAESRIDVDEFKNFPELVSKIEKLVDKCKSYRSKFNSHENDILNH